MRFDTRIRCKKCGQLMPEYVFFCGNCGTQLNRSMYVEPAASRLSDEKVEVTIEQLQSLLEVLCANDIRTAKEWLVNAIHQGKKDLRERSHK